MNNIIKTIQHRRSIRSFKHQQITDEQLNIIIEAGTYAPSAGGRQSPLIVACQNQEMIEKLWALNSEEMRKIAASRPPMNPNEKKPAKLPEAPLTTFYGAPTVVTIFAPKGWYNFTLDCAMAAQNMLLAADSIGVASCIVARAKEVFETQEGQEIKASWGIADEYEAKIHVLLGYVDGEIPEAKPRKADKVKIIK